MKMICFKIMLIGSLIRSCNYDNNSSVLCRKLAETTEKNKKRLSEMLDQSSSSDEDDAASEAPEVSNV